jgi:hypothetical protein
MTAKRPPGRPKGTTNARRRLHQSTAPSLVPGVGAVSVRLPLAHMTILGTEAKHLGLKRGQFLVLLLRRKRGEVQFERSPDTAKYRFTEEELRERKLWIWYLQADFRRMVDEDQLRMGLGSIGAWVTQILNSWIGRPSGLTDEVQKPK